MEPTVEQVRQAIELFWNTPEMVPAGWSAKAEHSDRGYWTVTTYTPAGVDAESHRVAVEIRNGRLELSHHAYRAPIASLDLPA